MIRVYLLLLFPLLAACGTANVRQDITNDSLQDTGLLIGSVTKQYSMKGYQGFSASSSGMRVYYRNLETGKRSTISTDPLMLGSFAQGDFDYEFGKLFVHELEPGRYAFDGWSLMQGSYTSIRPQRPNTYYFDIKAGEIVYVGELEFSVINGQNAFGIGVVAGIEQNIVDSERRDMRVVNIKYPNVDTGRVVKRLLVKSNGQARDDVQRETNDAPLLIPQK